MSKKRRLTEFPVLHDLEDLARGLDSSIEQSSSPHAEKETPTCIEPSSYATSQSSGTLNHVVCIKCDLSLVNREYIIPAIQSSGLQVGYIFTVDGLFDVLDLLSALLNGEKSLWPTGKGLHHGDVMHLFIDDLLESLPGGKYHCTVGCVNE